MYGSLSMRFSVVIATYNRAASLRQTLLSLRHQTYPDFEVIVVNCPSTDGTDAVLAEFADRVRAFRCDVVSSTISGNIGLAHSSGDIVAFIDDDAIPTPTWLQELADAGHTIEPAGSSPSPRTWARARARVSASCRSSTSMPRPCSPRGSLSLAAFQSTKSSGSSLPSSTATRSPARSWSIDLPESLP